MRNRHRSGNAIIEFTFMVPWLLFLFVGILDFGFYSYDLIATQNAARSAAARNSISKAAAGDSAGACQIALGELQATGNARNLSSCGAAPLQVTSAFLKGGGPDGNDAVQVVVTYTTDLMIPIPGVMSGKFTIVKNVLMRVDPFAVQ